MHLKEAVAILLNCRPGSTPVGIVTDAGRPGEKIVLASLDKLLEADINMTSIIIVGNSTSKIIDGKFWEVVYFLQIRKRGECIKRIENSYTRELMKFFL